MSHYVILSIAPKGYLIDEHVDTVTDCGQILYASHYKPLNVAFVRVH